MRREYKGDKRVRTKNRGGYEYSSEKMRNEKCVLCGCDTRILESVPVQDRKYYVHGCGQLCESCYQSLECEWKFVE